MWDWHLELADIVLIWGILSFECVHVLFEWALTGGRIKFQRLGLIHSDVFLFNAVFV